MQVVSIYAASFLVSAAIIGAQTKLNLKEEQKSGIRNSDVQKSNCIKLRQKEIEILEPTVIVIQYDYLHSKDLFDDAVQRDEKVYYSEIAKCYIVESSHPCCRKHPWKKDLDNSIFYLKDKGILPKIVEE